MGQPVTKTIFEYSDYREFLRDTFARRKAEDRKFSFRFFARIAGFKAHSFVKLVLQGKYDLSEESIEKFAKGLKLGKQESLFFKSMVLFNQSRTAQERQRFAGELVKSHAYRKLHPMTELQMNYYTHWYHTPIRELVCLPDFIEDPDWIAKKLDHKITPSEARKGLELLMKLGLLVRNEKGRLEQATPHVTSTDEVASAYLVQFHKEFLNRAVSAVETVPFEKREVSSVTVGITREKAKRIKEMIKSFRQEIVAVCSEEDAVETVYQINLQFFPLIKMDEDLSE